MRNIDNNDVAAPEGFIRATRPWWMSSEADNRPPSCWAAPGFPSFPKEVMAALSADYGIVGEGERMAALLDALEAGTPVDLLPGVVTHAAPCRFPHPLAVLRPRPFEPDRPHVAFYLRRGGNAQPSDQTGMPAQVHLLHLPPHRGAHLPAASRRRRVAGTARKLQEAGARYLFIADSAFNADARSQPGRRGGLPGCWAFHSLGRLSGPDENAGPLL